MALVHLPRAERKVKPDLDLDQAPEPAAKKQRLDDEDDGDDVVTGDTTTQAPPAPAPSPATPEDDNLAGADLEAQMDAYVLQKAAQRGMLNEGESLEVFMNSQSDDEDHEGPAPKPQVKNKLMFTLAIAKASSLLPKTLELTHGAHEVVGDHEERKSNHLLNVPLSVLSTVAPARKLTSGRRRARFIIFRSFADSARVAACSNSGVISTQVVSGTPMVAVQGLAGRVDRHHRVLSLGCLLMEIAEHVVRDYLDYYSDKGSPPIVHTEKSIPDEFLKFVDIWVRNHSDMLRQMKIRTRHARVGAELTTFLIENQLVALLGLTAGEVRRQVEEAVERAKTANREAEPDAVAAEEAQQLVAAEAALAATEGPLETVVENLAAPQVAQIVSRLLVTVPPSAVLGDGNVDTRKMVNNLYVTAGGHTDPKLIKSKTEGTKTTHKVLMLGASKVLEMLETVGLVEREPLQEGWATFTRVAPTEDNRAQIAVARRCPAFDLSPIAPTASDVASTVS